MSEHAILSVQRIATPTTAPWGDLLRFVSHCECGWSSPECYPESIAMDQYKDHLRDVAPFVPTAEGIIRNLMMSVDDDPDGAPYDSDFGECYWCGEHGPYDGSGLVRFTSHKDNCAWVAAYRFLHPDHPTTITEEGTS